MPEKAWNARRPADFRKTKDRIGDFARCSRRAGFAHNHTGPFWPRLERYTLKCSREICARPEGGKLRREVLFYTLCYSKATEGSSKTGRTGGRRLGSCWC